MKVSKRYPVIEFKKQPTVSGMDVLREVPGTVKKMLRGAKNQAKRMVKNALNPNMVAENKLKKKRYIND